MSARQRTHEEGEISGVVDNSARGLRSGGNFTGPHLLKGSNQAGKHGRRGDGNVVSAENQRNLGSERGQTANGGVIGAQVGVLVIKRDRGGIGSVAGKKQAVRAIEK